MRKLKDEFNGLLPQEVESRLSEFCTNAAELISCMNYVGLQDLKLKLAGLAKSTNSEKLHFVNILEHLREIEEPLEPLTQILFNIELLYIRFYMIEEIISKYKFLPRLKIENSKMFRLAFTHTKNESILSTNLPYVYFVSYLTPNLSEIHYSFFNFEGSHQRDVIMYQSKNMLSFQDWYNRVYNA